MSDNEITLPLEVMTDAKAAVPTYPIPVFAVIDGERRKVGTGRLDPETLLFTSTMDEEWGQEVLDAVERMEYEDEVGVGMVRFTEAQLIREFES